MTWPTFRHPPGPKGAVWPIVKHPRDRKSPDVAGRPWYLRPPAGHPSGKAWHSLGTCDAEAAITRARTFLAAFDGSTDRHHRAQAELGGPGAQTFGDLAAAWSAAGYPDDNERPRGTSAGDRLAPIMRRALVWWATRTPALTTRDTLREFARDRRARAATNRGATGERVIDLELAALSSLCQWAVGVGRLEKNPFAGRPRFRRPEDVAHCNAFRPASDEELHYILGWLWEPSQPPRRVVAGAWLAWCALTGQRPGEAAGLRVDGKATGDTRPPGHRWTLPDGSSRIAVGRAKGGINPAVRVHPALEDFLSAWLTIRRRYWSASPWYWPNPANPALALPVEHLGAALEAATRALKLPARHPHAMRAFYVRVRRAAGVEDSQVAAELGHGGGAGLIPKVYGRGDDILGDGSLDWLPTPPILPAWCMLTSAPAPRLADP